jgi:hypothetical protein
LVPDLSHFNYGRDTLRLAANKARLFTADMILRSINLWHLCR